MSKPEVDHDVPLTVRTTADKPRRILPDKPALVALVKASRVLDGLESDEQRAFVLQSLTALYGKVE